MQPLASSSKGIKLKVIEATFTGLHMSKTVQEKSLSQTIDKDHHIDQIQRNFTLETTHQLSRPKLQ